MNMATEAWQAELNRTPQPEPSTRSRPGRLCPNPVGQPPPEEGPPGEALLVVESFQPRVRKVRPGGPKQVHDPADVCGDPQQGELRT